MNNPNRIRSIALIVIALLLAAISLAQTPRNMDPVMAAQSATATATPAPITAWQSGSTDAIFLWATLLVIIIIVALVWHRADWAVRKA